MKGIRKIGNRKKEVKLHGWRYQMPNSGSAYMNNNTSLFLRRSA
jgi:hypothetical protein